jgi:large subunit ribosomal protein L24
LVGPGKFQAGVIGVRKKHPKIKKNDKVIVLVGKEKGKIGTVLKVDVEKEKLIVEKVNMIKAAFQAEPADGARWHY